MLVMVGLGKLGELLVVASIIVFMVSYSMLESSLQIRMDQVARSHTL